MLERVELTALSKNPRAQKIYERLGFVVEGRKRGPIISDGRYEDEILMARLRPDGVIAPAKRA